MRNSIFTAAVVTSALILAGCNSTRKNDPTAGLTPAEPVAAQPNATPNGKLNGNWLPTDEAAKGVYVAEFKDGAFVSRSPTTQKLLAKGSYKVVSDTNVDLDFVGAATNRAVKAKCELKTESTMFCVPTVGSAFNLQRV